MLLALYTPLQRLDFAWIDAKFSLQAQLQKYESEDDPVVIGIDEKSLAAAPQPLAMWHAELAEVFTTLSALQPKGVLIDLELPTRDFANAPDGIRELATGLSKLRAVSPVALGRGVNEEGTLTLAHPLVAAVVGTDNLGVMTWEFDSDGTVRRFLPSLAAGDVRVDTLALIALRAQGLPTEPGLLNYALGKKFSLIPIKKLMGTLTKPELANLRQSIQGRFVVIGTAMPFIDRVRQPRNMAEWENRETAPGMLLYAQAYRTAVQGGTIQYSRWYGACLAICLAVCCALFAQRAKRLVIFAGAAVFALLPFSLFATSLGYQIDIVGAAGALLIGAAIVLSRAMLLSIRERNRVLALFSGYISPAILDTIVSGQLDSYSSKRRVLSFLFADIRGFTTYSATTPPEEVILLLNRYFEVMTLVIHAYGGTVDKFRGDGIMAFFGAPQILDNAPASAIRAGLGMAKALATLNRELRNEGQQPIEIGIGISHGEAIIGNIGSRLRHDYTAIGSAVNLAAHIQEHCKKAQNHFLLDAKTFDAASLTGEELRSFISLGPQMLAKHGDIDMYGWNGDAKGDEP